MAILDTAGELTAGASLQPQAHTSTSNGSSVDVSDALGVLFVTHVGTYNDGTITIQYEESDDDSTWSAIADGDLHIGATGQTNAEPVIDASGDADSAFVTSYTGNNKFVRVTITSVSGVTNGAEIGGTVVKRLENVSSD